MKKKRLSGEKSFLLLKTPPKLNYSSSLEYKNFRSFLKDIEDVLLTKDEKIIKEIKEKINIKIPKLYSLNQFEKVYRKTFFKKRRK